METLQNNTKPSLIGTPEALTWPQDRVDAAFEVLIRGFDPDDSSPEELRKVRDRLLHELVDGRAAQAVLEDFTKLYEIYSDRVQTFGIGPESQEIEVRAFATRDRYNLYLNERYIQVAYPDGSTRTVITKLSDGVATTYDVKAGEAGQELTVSTRRTYDGDHRGRYASIYGAEDIDDMTCRLIEESSRTARLVLSRTDEERDAGDEQAKVMTGELTQLARLRDMQSPDEIETMLDTELYGIRPVSYENLRKLGARAAH